MLMISTTSLTTIVEILKKTDDGEDKMIKILYQLKPGEGEHLSNALETLPWEDHAWGTLILVLTIMTILTITTIMTTITIVTIMTLIAMILAMKILRVQL